MAVTLNVKGEFRGVGVVEFEDKVTKVTNRYPYMRLEIEEETQRVSCKQEVIDEVEKKFKKGQEIALFAKVSARDNNLKMSFVRW